MQILADLEEVQEFFFRAALKTYVGEAKATRGLMGRKSYHVDERRFIYHDEFLVSPHSHGSFGQTVITANVNGAWVPVWAMQYMGYYLPEATDFLKEALREAYELKLFVGGRGPREFWGDEGSLLYINEPEPDSLFSNFRGKEKILGSEKERRQLGEHYYAGFSLLP